jgi:predicted MPP superfamily phosphohydrolase
MRWIFFFPIWISIIILAYFYVGRRIVNAAQLQGRPKRAVLILFIMLFLLSMIPFFIRIFGHFETQGIDIVSRVGFAGLGLFSFLVSFIFLRDIGYALVRLMSKLSSHLRTSEKKDTEITDFERRRFLIHSTNLGIMSLATGFTGYSMFEATLTMQTENVIISLPHLPESFDGFRIVQFSDTHVGPTLKRAFIEKVAHHIQELNPDLIAFTGDLVDGTVDWLKDDVEPLKDLVAPNGQYFITGNHEYYSGAPPWIAHADKLGFDVLLNEHRVIGRGANQIVLAGVTDYSAGQFIPSQASDPFKAIAGAPSDLVRILLAHQPRSIFQASEAGFDLQLSGHTHGGQFFPWNYVATLNQPYIKGLYRHNNMFIYVNRGIGFWGPPMRLKNPPEITLIRLTKTNSSKLT